MRKDGSSASLGESISLEPWKESPTTLGLNNVQFLCLQKPFQTIAGVF